METTIKRLYRDYIGDILGVMDPMQLEKGLIKS